MPSLALSRRLTLSSPWHRQAFAKLTGFALLLLLAGCATGPQHPLYSPLAVTGSFGFTEQRLNDSSFRITYIAPRRTVFSPYANAEPGRTALLNLANDMALMRAAEVTSANGHQTFRVSQRDNDADVSRERYTGMCDDPFWPRRSYYHPLSRFPSNRHCGSDGYTYFQARSTITIQFGHKPGEEHFVAQAVLAQLSQTYPTARAAGSANP